MNIFVLDKDPELAVKYLCNAHIVKMTLETCQLLCTQEYVSSESKGKSVINPPALDWPELYNPTHKNHPCRRCLDSVDNYNWLVKYFSCICKEYTYRYGKRHLCELYSLTWFNFRRNWDENKLSFPKCMPEEYKEGGNDIDSIVRSYRNYYKYKSETLSRFYYTNRNLPIWIKS